MPAEIRLWDPRRVLESPPIYNLFQRAVGADKPRRRFVKDHIAPLGNARVLEVGCGPGTNCRWMPRSIQYVGCDLSEAYVGYAKEHYGERAEFFAAPVGQLATLSLKPFNAVFALALLHHLDDDQILTLCDEVVPLLQAGGHFMTGDPCFCAGQGRLERFVTSCDRGRYVRYPERYQALLAKRFSMVEMEVKRAQGMLIPNTGVVLKALV